MRRLCLSLLILAGLCLLLWPEHDVPPAPAGFVVVDYWEKWTGEEARQMRLIVDDFNQSIGRDKKIFVRYQSISAVNEKTLVATAAGDPPDIAGLWDEEVGQFASLGALLKIDDLAASLGRPISPDIYKPIYWKQCTYHGHLYALISTPCTYALHYNKRIFYENAAPLRAGGLDPTRAPRTIEELDRYAKILDRFDPDHSGRILRTGYLPMEPNIAPNLVCYWFGGDIFDEKTGKFTLPQDANVRAYNWIRSYGQRLGPDAITNFRSGLGNFDSVDNPFVTGKLAMELQGPWMANFIDRLNPGMSQTLVPFSLEPYLPRVLRPFNYDWGVAPFPSAVPGQNDVTYASFDSLVIPRTAKHPREAFEFIMYVNRQDVMEKLCSLHCKNSPLTKVSEHFIQSHPNPYAGMFDDLARSPSARGLAELEIWPLVHDELANMAQQVYLQSGPPQRQTPTLDILRNSQDRLQQEHDLFQRSQELRDEKIKP